MPSTPFGPPPVPPSSSKKPIAPISSNAFAFSLATPSKPSFPNTSRRTPHQSTPIPLKAARKDFLPRPGPSDASSSRTPSVRLSGTPLRTVKKEEDTTTPRRATVRLNDLSNPFIRPILPTAPVETKGKRKLNEALNQDSPFRPHPPRPNPYESKEMRGVSDLRDVVNVDTIVEFSEVDRVKTEQEEGVGVSPRRIKGISNWGKGPTSMSKQLTDILSSQTSAIVLFYTSLQHSLIPARPVPPPRGARPAFPQPNLPITVKTEGASTVLSHSRTAPLRLQLKWPVKGRTQYAHIWHCKVLKWPEATPTVDYLGEVIPEDRDPPELVLCVFQSLPSDCPRIGLDPRLLASRLEGVSGETEKKWEVGVWGPWSDVDMVTDIALKPRMVLKAKEEVHDGSQEWPEELEDNDGEEAREMNREERREAPAPEDTEPMGEKRITKVLFASRYLIAER